MTTSPRFHSKLLIGAHLTPPAKNKKKFHSPAFFSAFGHVFYLRNCFEDYSLVVERWPEPYLNKVQKQFRSFQQQWRTIFCKYRIRPITSKGRQYLRNTLLESNDFLKDCRHLKGRTQLVSSQDKARPGQAGCVLCFVLPQERVREAQDVIKTLDWLTNITTHQLSTKDWVVSVCIWWQSLGPICWSGEVEVEHHYWSWRPYTTHTSHLPCKASHINYITTVHSGKQRPISLISHIITLSRLHWDVLFLKPRLESIKKKPPRLGLKAYLVVISESYLPIIEGRQSVWWSSLNAHWCLACKWCTGM